MALDGECLPSAPEEAACSSLIMGEKEDLGGGYTNLGLFHLAAMPSIPCGSEAEATAIYQTESGGSHEASPAESNNIIKLPKRRRKARMNEVDEETQLRRRAQNRESQQAYRHRREDHIQNLQRQIVYLHLQHRDLWQSFCLQDKRLGLLREVVADLTMEVSVLRGRRPQQQQQQQLTQDESLLLEDECDCGIASNDPLYPRCSGIGANIDVEELPILGQDLQECLSEHAPIYSSPCHTSEYPDLH
ncbi:uncharacterized protein Z519_07337 [Cladophialophora bantiana CBS 173.52]|uniref:BZIP domain-containing protein n=1 Tax=Cladophialophora bantiana (strain ATCC 10958 / CBS 173.52 / CDC B-1940 / NIH 8579) TaxID=1442370 RepID=A0A0D2HGE6_CLAB1|nr:uncharacterized protein Z519_07337 [Cladophialophora bantiana CBS 173.52]KIW92353.1 hypothetical protein Z519_07337 [Cladophialophora bantiana CBS 173.52]